MPSESSDHDAAASRDVEAELAAERAASAYWRTVARKREADYAKLRRRPSVRVLLGVEWRLLRLRPAIAAVLERGHAFVDRLVLATNALCARPLRRSTRDPATLRAKLAALPEPSVKRRRVTLVDVGRRFGNLLDTVPDSLEVDVVRVGASPDIVDDVRRALESADSELVGVILASTEACDGTWLTRLAAAIDDGAGVLASTPLLVHPERPPSHATPHDGRVRSAGLSLELYGGVPVVTARGAGDTPAPQRPVHEVGAASAACLLVDRAGYQRSGGLPLTDDLDVAVAELCVKLQARGGAVVVVPGSVMTDARPVPSRRALRSPIPAASSAWRAAVERSGPAFVRATRPSSACLTRFAFTVAAPSLKVAPRWGDWHLAEAMAAALRRRGHDVLLQTADRADHLAGRAADVHVVVRGLHPVSRTPGQRHVLWIINHPESIDDDELDAADLVLVASPRFAAHLRTRTQTPVEVLLQATDHHRFYPRPVDPAFAHSITVVAKTRDVLRPVVVDALRAGLRPAIYGDGWKSIVDPQLVVADHVDNEDLPIVYSSAGVVLNDHWQTMRAWGFVSNRLYDVLACGAPVISDAVPGIADVFDGAVLEYRDSDELRVLAEQVLSDPAGARERAARGRAAVLARHTFDIRAKELTDMLARHTSPA